MKLAPEFEAIQSKMKNSNFSSSGFLGSDTRGYLDIIDADKSILSMLNISKEELADKMESITKIAMEGFGSPIIIDNIWEAIVDDSRGKIPCPFNHISFSFKRITYLKNLKTGDNISWSDLNIHMIREHCFFEGKDADFRVEPVKLYKILFG
jgi:hypothetical protein